MIRNLLAKLSARMHTIDAIDARQQELSTRLDSLKAELERQSQQSTERHQVLLEALQSLSGVEQGHFNTLLQAEFGSREIAVTPHLETYRYLAELRQALGRVESRQTALLPPEDWDAMSFSVTSQFGEDGFLQHLVRQVPNLNHSFIEFGVEDYKESNTRFLLQKDRWRGLVLEGNPEQVRVIESDPLYSWRDLTVASAFITTDNVDTLFTEQGFTGEIGLLSIDIDGNDFWIWKAIQSIQPQIVSIEYNFRFGLEIAAAVPYNPSFSKNEAHPSRIYYGSSLLAITGLAHERGYDLVGCSDGGVNAFFVRRDCRPKSLPSRTVQEAYRAGQHAEAYDNSDVPVKRSFAWQKELLLSLPLERFPQWEKANL